MSVSPSKGRVKSRLKAAGSPRHVQLFQTLVLLFLTPNVCTHDLFLQPHRRDAIPSRPETLSAEVAFPTEKGASKEDFLVYRSSRSNLCESPRQSRGFTYVN